MSILHPKVTEVLLVICRGITVAAIPVYFWLVITLAMRGIGATP